MANLRDGFKSRDDDHDKKDEETGIKKNILKG